MAKKPEPKPQVAPDSEKQLSTNVLTDAEREAAYGDLSREHVSIPRLAVLEQLSPQVKDNLGKVGELFITGINQSLGTEPVEIVVLMRSHSHISWKPISEGGGIMCQALDGKTGIGLPGGVCTRCPQKEWSTNSEGKAVKPLCDVYENLIVVLRKDLQEGSAFPMAISGARTRLKGLKDFNIVLMQLAQRRLPPFAKSYFIRAVQKTKGINTWSVFQITPGNNNALLPETEQQAAGSLFKSICGKAIVIDQPTPAEEGSAAIGDGPAI